jgi:hypothetical protein
VNDTSTVNTGPRSDVDNPVGSVDCVFIVLDNDERVSEVSQLDQRVDESPIVSLVETDTWLIENVEHPG